MDYETIGELFRQATQNSHELTVSERIWQAILEFVSAITKVFSIDDEEVLDALINESDELTHICKLYQCKMASWLYMKHFFIFICHLSLNLFNYLINKYLVW